MADRRIYAGYYQRYDGKLIYVVSMAKDADSGEDIVIWTPFTYSETHRGSAFPVCPLYGYAGQPSKRTNTLP